MSGEDPGPDSIEERIKRGEVRLDMWAAGGDVQIWVFAALYVGLLCYGLLGGVGKAWLYLAVGVLGAVPIWLFFAQRRPRAGRAIVLDSKGVRLELDHRPLVSIPWNELKGVTFKFKGLAVYAKDGDHFVIPGVEYGYKSRELQKSIGKYLVRRSSILTEERDLLPKPRPQSLLRRNIWIWACSSGALFVLQAFFGKSQTLKELTPDESTNGLVLSLVLLLAFVVTCALAFRSWKELGLWQSRYDWDRDAPLPEVMPADTEQHRLDHRKNPPLVEMVEGTTYVHRNFSLSVGLMRLSIWLIIPTGALFLVAPWLASLDGSVPIGSTVFFVLLSFCLPSGLLLISCAIFYAFVLRPYLSKFTRSGDELIVEYGGRTSSFSANVVSEKRMWIWPTYFGGRWEVYGQGSRTALIDRRYLREIVEGDRIDLR